MNQSSGHAGPTNHADHATIVSSRDGRRSRYGGAFLLAVLLLFGLHIAMLMTRGPFMNIYLDFAAELPLITSIATSIWTFVAVGILLVVTVAKEHVLKNKSLARIWNQLVFLGTIILICVYVVALLKPLLQLIGPGLV